MYFAAVVVFTVLGVAVVGEETSWMVTTLLAFTLPSKIPTHTRFSLASPVEELAVEPSVEGMVVPVEPPALVVALLVDKVNLITAGSLDSCVTAFSLPAQDANKPTDMIPANTNLLILIRF
jgi:hypothetical protein